MFLYGKRLRLVVSPVPRIPDSKGKREPWYILSTDKRSKRHEVLKVYRQRFEIEETFKDFKHLFDIKSLRIKKKLTFMVLLWFACIAFWLSWWIKERSKTKKVNKKKFTSYARVWLEGLQREINKKLIEVAAPT